MWTSVLDDLRGPIPVVTIVQFNTSEVPVPLSPDDRR
jgi:hypothetical protein